MGCVTRRSPLDLQSIEQVLCLAAWLSIHFKVEHWVSIRNRFSRETRAYDSPECLSSIPDVRREASFAGSFQAVAQFPGVDPLPLNGVII